MDIDQVGIRVQREPFARPFGFKGAFFHEKWNAVVRLTDSDGREAIGLGGLAPLWADARVFLKHGEDESNRLMLSILEFALQQAEGQPFYDPPALLDAVLPVVHEYGERVTGVSGLSQTFTLNTLVALDNAAWLLRAAQSGATSFDQLVPSDCLPALAERHRTVAAVPLITYKLGRDDIVRMLDEGYFVLKVKIGQPGDESEMLEKDQARLTEVHKLARRYETVATADGNVLYYLDANGRYTEKQSMHRLLDHAEKIGAAERIVLIEEPFAEELELEVNEIPAHLAADESVDRMEDIAVRVAQGYRAVALKPAGKTLTMAFRMARSARAHGVPTFVADNACVPILVDWNKNVAGRLGRFPGLKGGILESNGPDSYATWDRMLEEHPCAGASWLRPRQGAFQLNEDFYKRSGGIFLSTGPYADLFSGPSGAEGA